MLQIPIVHESEEWVLLTVLYLNKSTFEHS